MSTIFRSIDGTPVRLELAYSPNDGGWYFTRWDTNDTSIIYATAADALAADPITWEQVS